MILLVLNTMLSTVITRGNSIITMQVVSYTSIYEILLQSPLQME